MPGLNSRLVSSSVRFEAELRSNFCHDLQGLDDTFVRWLVRRNRPTIVFIYDPAYSAGGLMTEPGPTRGNVPERTVYFLVNTKHCDTKDSFAVII